MIFSFKCKETRKIFSGEFSKKFPHSIQTKALEKLIILNASICISDLKIPPSNKLEKLKNDRKGQYSIRVNEKYRVCFGWVDSKAINVEIVDYH